MVNSPQLLTARLLHIYCLLSGPDPIYKVVSAIFHDKLVNMLQLARNNKWVWKLFVRFL